MIEANEEYEYEYDDESNAEVIEAPKSLSVHPVGEESEGDIRKGYEEGPHQYGSSPSVPLPHQYGGGVEEYL
jgi:hypothetical protein